MKKKLLKILACPICKRSLVYAKNKKELICETDKLAYPIRKGVPILLNSDARNLD